MSQHQKPNQSSQLRVIARSPFNTFYEGPANGLSAINPVGKFDILPGHADFFSMLVPCKVVIDTDEDPVEFDISNGIITVRDNSINLFVNM
jgi:F0F1-type ATP synthase epsilon subunit